MATPLGRGGAGGAARATRTRDGDGDRLRLALRSRLWGLGHPERRPAGALFLLRHPRGRKKGRDDDADEVDEGRRAAHSTGGRRARGSTSDCGRSPPFASASRSTRGCDAPSACAVRVGRGGLTRRRRSPRVAPESAREVHRRYAPKWRWPIPVKRRPPFSVLGGNTRREKNKFEKLLAAEMLSLIDLDRVPPRATPLLASHLATRLAPHPATRLPFAERRSSLPRLDPGDRPSRPSSDLARRVTNNQDSRLAPRTSPWLPRSPTRRPPR